MFPHDKTNEWIAQELIRIKENQEPRQCPDYEALIEHIEELSRAELMLGRAFNALWHYCWDPSSAPHHPTPIRVLLGLEHIFSLEEEQQPSVQIQLSTLLTIPIPTSSPWLAAWQVIHQWLHSLCTPHTDWQPLLSVGLHAYHSARSRHGPLPEHLLTNKQSFSF
ncbi:hypothetical protein [Absidia glauca]|jgi:hypothetical protein|uniref:Uncharacterized protein n=1 Tax=Absidia glauca TaxID=4829 RepID=A0A168SBW7_ABSGL|nr:hypothetical protein [Absidia glauca]